MSSIFNLQDGDKVTVHRFQVRPELELRSGPVWVPAGGWKLQVHAAGILLGSPVLCLSD